MAPLKILGIDPGSRAAGWAVVSFDGPPRLIAAGVLRPDTRLPFPERLRALRDGLLEVLDREGPDEAAVERAFSGVNPQSLIRLGEARGVLLLALAERGVAVAELTPAEIKRSVTGAGAAEKEQVRRMVGALLGGGAGAGPVRGRLALDAADAAAAALAHGFLVSRRGVRSVAASVASPGSGTQAIRRRPTG